MVKDAVSQFIFDPVKDSVVGGTLDATGLSGVAAAAGRHADSAMRAAHKAQEVARMLGYK